MFDYNQYKKELDIINKEELDVKYEEGKYGELLKPFIAKRNDLNKKYNIIFIHNLHDAWLIPIEKFFLIDSEQNNVVIYNHERNKQYIYTISNKDIKKINQFLNNNPNLFENNEIIFPPIFDGSMHKVYIRSEEKNIEFNCYNLWYWLNEEPKIDKNNNENYSEDDVEYTKIVIKAFKEIQQILNKNNIKYKILE